MSDHYSIKLISKNGDFLSLLKRMEEAGHNVQAYVEGCEDMYEGMIPKVHDLNELDIGDGDMVIFDMVGGGKGADMLKSKGIYVIGGGELNDKLELDREFGMDFMVKHQVPIPPSFQVSGVKEAEQWIKETKKRYVFKPSGNLDTDLTYVSSSAEDLLRMLDYLKERVPEDCPIVLQEFVEGVEMSTEGFFNGEKFLMPLNSTFEEKKFLTGGLGPNTGCSGNVVWFWDEYHSEIIYDLLFKNLEEPLAEAGYVGPLDINAIWTDKGPMALEFTTRFGYDAIQCSSRLIDMELGAFLRQLPELSEVPLTTSTYALSVRVSVPPYPSKADVPHTPLVVDKANPDNIYLSDVMKEEDGLYCAGSDGYVVCVADDGKRLNTLQARVYSEVEKLDIPDMQYRIDIGDRVERDRQQVTAWLDRYGSKA